MILLPQIYLRNGKVVTSENTKTTLFTEDPLKTVSNMKDAGASSLHIIDLSITPVGASPNLQLIKKIHDEMRMSIYVSAGFKSRQGIDAYIHIGAELVIMGSIAYQQPLLVSEVCRSFPARIATHIDVRAGKVTIPGYAVVANKTAFDYADHFLDCGVRYFLYSDVGANGFMSDENYNNLAAFCQKVTARVICTSEIASFADIERMINLALPRLDGIVLAKALHEGRLDLKSTLARANELLLSRTDESTLAE